MAQPRRKIVIVGGSIAAVTAAQVLRAEGFEGNVTMLSDEAHLPYSRVPLSKAVLSGAAHRDTCALPLAQDEIHVRLGQRAVELDVQSRIIHLANGETVPYDGLVIATGARARRLAHPGQAGEFVVRDADDVEQLAPRLRTASTAVIIGAGFLGMEIASTCTKLGLQVTVIDRDPPLRRLLGEWLSSFVVDRAELSGVRFLRAPQGVDLVGLPTVRGVRVGDEVIKSDVVTSAIGDVPNSEWLHGSPLEILRGAVVVDQRCVAAPDIVAAGDIAAIRNDAGQVNRLPHWNNAVRQARSAAMSLLHGVESPIAEPDHYFWTEAFGLQIKVCGLIPDMITPVILESSDNGGSLILQWLSSEGEPVAAATVNRKMPVSKIRRLATEMDFRGSDSGLGLAVASR